MISTFRPCRRTFGLQECSGMNRWNKIPAASRSRTQTDFLEPAKSESAARISSRMERTRRRINCVAWARCMIAVVDNVTLAFSRKYKIIPYTELLASLRDERSEKERTIRSAPAALALSVIIPGFQLSSSFHVGKTSALSFPRWNFYWRSPVT